MTKMSRLAKLALVIGGYLVACLAASGAVYVNGLFTQNAAAQASAGMYAFFVPDPLRRYIWTPRPPPNGFGALFSAQKISNPIASKRNWRSYGIAIVQKGIVMAGKYTPLENYLRDLPESQREVTLRFEEIEGILNAKLPSSAYEDRRWWDHEKEGNHVTARSWSNAGWKIESLDINEKWVKLVRAE